MLWPQLLWQSCHVCSYLSSCRPNLSSTLLGCRFINSKLYSWPVLKKSTYNHKTFNEFLLLLPPPPADDSCPRKVLDSQTLLPEKKCRREKRKVPELGLSIPGASMKSSPYKLTIASIVYCHCQHDLSRLAPFLPRSWLPGFSGFLPYAVTNSGHAEDLARRLRLPAMVAGASTS